jgi:hypothetical protein
MTEYRQQLWAQETGKSIAAPKLVCLQQLKDWRKNVYTAQFQIEHWYSALNQDPTPFNALDYEWKVDEANKCMIPRSVAEGITHVPEQIMKLVKYGCVSQPPSKGVNCGCNGHQLSCTMFCVCGGDCTCLNHFNTKDTHNAVIEDVDTDNDQDEDVEDICNDEEDCVK